MNQSKFYFSGSLSEEFSLAVIPSGGDGLQHKPSATELSNIVCTTLKCEKMSAERFVVNNVLFKLLLQAGDGECRMHLCSEAPHIQLTRTHLIAESHNHKLVAFTIDFHQFDAWNTCEVSLHLEEGDPSELGDITLEAARNNIYDYLTHHRGECTYGTVLLAVQNISTGKLIKFNFEDVGFLVNALAKERRILTDLEGIEDKFSDKGKRYELFTSLGEAYHNQDKTKSIPSHKSVYHVVDPVYQGKLDRGLSVELVDNASENMILFTQWGKNKTPTRLLFSTTTQDIINVSKAVYYVKGRVASFKEYKEHLEKRFGNYLPHDVLYCPLANTILKKLVAEWKHRVNWYFDMIKYLQKKPEELLNPEYQMVAEHIRQYMPILRSCYELNVDSFVFNLLALSEKLAIAVETVRPEEMKVFLSDDALRDVYNPEGKVTTICTAWGYWLQKDYFIHPHAHDLEEVKRRYKEKQSTIAKQILEAATKKRKELSNSQHLYPKRFKSATAVYLHSSEESEDSDGETIGSQDTVSLASDDSEDSDYIDE